MMNIRIKNEHETPELRMGICSIIGARESQQDSAAFYSGNAGVLALVCDGMGGMDDGGKASRLAIEDFSQAYAKRDRSISVPVFFRETAQAVNEKITNFHTASGKRMNSGTTAVGISYENGAVHWISIGDSRIYLLRGNELHQVNREHTYRERLKDMLKNGEITLENYNVEEKTRKAEALTSYLGIRTLSLMEINRQPFPLQKGDILVLCSDGLYKSLNNDQIKAMILDNDIDLNIAADRLCQMALRYGGSGQDNTTVLLLQFQPKGE